MITIENKSDQELEQPVGCQAVTLVGCKRVKLSGWRLRGEREVLVTLNLLKCEEMELVGGWVFGGETHDPHHEGCGIQLNQCRVVTLTKTRVYTSGDPQFPTTDLVSLYWSQGLVLNQVEVHGLTTKFGSGFCVDYRTGGVVFNQCQTQDTGQVGFQMAGVGPVEYHQCRSTGAITPLSIRPSEYYPQFPLSGKVKVVGVSGLVPRGGHTVDVEEISKHLVEVEK